MTLFNVFIDNFVQYVKENFEVLNKNVIINLRDYLRVNKAYIKKERKLSIIKELANVIKEEIL